MARSAAPLGIAVDPEDNLIVVDASAHTVRKITAAGYVSTLAGQPKEAGFEDGGAGTARFNRPQGVAVDALGGIFVADTGNATIRRIAADGQVSTVAGVPGRVGAGLGPLPGSLPNPTSVAVTRTGDLLVTCGTGVVQITP